MQIKKKWSLDFLRNKKSQLGRVPKSKFDKEPVELTVTIIAAGGMHRNDLVLRKLHGKQRKQARRYAHASGK